MAPDPSPLSHNLAVIRHSTSLFKVGTANGHGTLSSRSSGVKTLGCMDYWSENYTAKNATDLFAPLSILPACCKQSASCNKLVSFIKLQQVCQNQACCDLSYIDLLKAHLHDATSRMRLSI